MDLISGYLLVIVVLVDNKYCFNVWIIGINSLKLLVLSILSFSLFFLDINLLYTLKII